MVDELATFHVSEKGRVLIDRCSMFEVFEPDDPEWSSDPSSGNQRFFPKEGPFHRSQRDPSRLASSRVGS